MLEETDLDAVIISTSHYLHYTMVMNAIKMSKHVLVDKPTAINLKEADEMINEARKKA
jgi:predicted dehydrogenase